MKLLDQKRDGNDARISDYFDVIAGTSTGGIIASLLAAPHPHHKNRPLFTASEILQYYKQWGPLIFNQTRYLLLNFSNTHRKS